MGVKAEGNRVGGVKAEGNRCKVSRLTMLYRQYGSEFKKLTMSLLLHPDIVTDNK